MRNFLLSKPPTPNFDTLSLHGGQKPDPPLAPEQHQSIRQLPMSSKIRIMPSVYSTSSEPVTFTQDFQTQPMLSWKSVSLYSIMVSVLLQPPAARLPCISPCVLSSMPVNISLHHAVYMAAHIPCWTTPCVDLESRRLSLTRESPRPLSRPFRTIRDWYSPKFSETPVSRY